MKDEKATEEVIYFSNEDVISTSGDYTPATCYINFC